MKILGREFELTFTFIAVCPNAHPHYVHSLNRRALRTTFVQKFSLTGGSNGRISRGDEVVELELL